MRAASRIGAYNVVFVLLALLLAPIAAVLVLLRPSWRRGLAGRLGIGWPAGGRHPVLWAHAASVGEVEAIVPLVQRWQQRNPNGSTVFSALTATGCAHARRLVPGAAVVTFPIDAPGLAGHVVRRVQPDLFLFSENEIWPNTLHALERTGVPTVQVSGRLSAGAAATLARFPGFTRAVLGRVSCFCVQSDEDCARLLALGVAPERVVVTGSLKGDARTAEAPAFLAALVALGRPIVVAASTHAGEDEAVIGALHALRHGGADVVCVLAPRHPERFAAVAALLDRTDLRTVRRSQLAADGVAQRAQLQGADVLLLDGLGELAGCYRAAAVAFVGGTLVPIGGHNLLEAARCGVPIVVGPHLDTVRKIADRLVAAAAATVVREPEQLGAALASYLDPARHAAAGSAARKVADEEAGSLETTWQVLARVSGEALDDGAQDAAGSAAR